MDQSVDNIENILLTAVDPAKDVDLSQCTYQESSVHPQSLFIKQPSLHGQSHPNDSQECQLSFEEVDFTASSVSRGCSTDSEDNSLPMPGPRSADFIIGQQQRKAVETKKADGQAGGGVAKKQQTKKTAGGMLEDAGTKNIDSHNYQQNRYQLIQLKMQGQPTVARRVNTSDIAKSYPTLLEELNKPYSTDGLHANERLNPLHQALKLQEPMSCVTQQQQQQYTQQQDLHHLEEQQQQPQQYTHQQDLHYLEEQQQQCQQYTQQQDLHYLEEQQQQPQQYTQQQDLHYLEQQQQQCQQRQEQHQQLYQEHQQYLQQHQKKMPCMIRVKQHPHTPLAQQSSSKHQHFTTAPPNWDMSSQAMKVPQLRESLNSLTASPHATNLYGKLRAPVPLNNSVISPPKNSQDESYTHRNNADNMRPTNTPALHRENLPLQPIDTPMAPGLSPLYNISGNQKPMNSIKETSKLWRPNDSPESASCEAQVSFDGCITSSTSSLQTQTFSAVNDKNVSQCHWDVSTGLKDKHMKEINSNAQNSVVSMNRFSPILENVKATCGQAMTWTSKSMDLTPSEKMKNQCGKYKTSTPGHVQQVSTVPSTTIGEINLNLSLSSPSPSAQSVASSGNNATLTNTNVNSIQSVDKVEKVTVERKLTFIDLVELSVLSSYGQVPKCSDEKKSTDERKQANQKPTADSARDPGSLGGVGHVNKTIGSVMNELEVVTKSCARGNDMTDAEDDCSSALVVIQKNIKNVKGMKSAHQSSALNVETVKLKESSEPMVSNSNTGVLTETVEQSTSGGSVVWDETEKSKSRDEKKSDSSTLNGNQDVIVGRKENTKDLAVYHRNESSKKGVCAVKPFIGSNNNNKSLSETSTSGNSAVCTVKPFPGNGNNSNINETCTNDFKRQDAYTAQLAVKPRQSLVRIPNSIFSSHCLLVTCAGCQKESVVSSYHFFCVHCLKPIMAELDMIKCSCGLGMFQTLPDLEYHLQLCYSQTALNAHLKTNKESQFPPKVTSTVFSASMSINKLENAVKMALGRLKTNVHGMKSPPQGSSVVTEQFTVSKQDIEKIDTELSPPAEIVLSSETENSSEALEGNMIVDKFDKQNNNTNTTDCVVTLNRLNKKKLFKKTPEKQKTKAVTNKTNDVHLSRPSVPNSSGDGKAGKVKMVAANMENSVESESDCISESESEVTSGSGYEELEEEDERDMISETVEEVKLTDNETEVERSSGMAELERKPGTSTMACSVKVANIAGEQKKKYETKASSVTSLKSWNDIEKKTLKVVLDKRDLGIRVERLKQSRQNEKSADTTKNCTLERSLENVRDKCSNSGSTRDMNIVRRNETQNFTSNSTDKGISKINDTETVKEKRKEMFKDCTKANVSVNKNVQANEGKYISKMEKATLNNTSPCKVIKTKKGSAKIKSDESASHREYLQDILERNREMAKQKIEELRSANKIGLLSRKEAKGSQRHSIRPGNYEAVSGLGTEAYEKSVASLEEVVFSTGVATRKERVSEVIQVRNCSSDVEELDICPAGNKAESDLPNKQKSHVAKTGTKMSSDRDKARKVPSPINIVNDMFEAEERIFSNVKELQPEPKRGPQQAVEIVTDPNTETETHSDTYTYASEKEQRVKKKRKACIESDPDSHSGKDSYNRGSRIRKRMAVLTDSDTDTHTENVTVNYTRKLRKRKGLRNLSQIYCESSESESGRKVKRRKTPSKDRNARHSVLTYAELSSSTDSDGVVNNDDDVDDKNTGNERGNKHQASDIEGDSMGEKESGPDMDVSLEDVTFKQTSTKSKKRTGKYTCQKCRMVFTNLYSLAKHMPYHASLSSESEPNIELTNSTDFSDRKKAKQLQISRDVESLIVMETEQSFEPPVDTEIESLPFDVEVDKAETEQERITSAPVVKSQGQTVTPGLSSFPCVLCRTYFHRKDELENHMTKHSPYFSCSCGLPFMSKDILDRHVKVVHGGDMDPQRSCTEVEEEFICGICETKFPAPDMLQFHMKSHLSVLAGNQKSISHTPDTVEMTKSITADANYTGNSSSISKSEVSIKNTGKAKREQSTSHTGKIIKQKNVESECKKVVDMVTGSQKQEESKASAAVDIKSTSKSTVTRLLKYKPKFSM